ncbi:MAG: hypothetical protein O3B09_00960 [Proteobacteria bacterium]|nr:hypothetical protein [Pseudomonadota bacterium]
MISILKYIFLTASRDWLYLGLLIILVAAFGISSLLGSTALAEQQEMSIVYISGSSRMILAIGIILFVCFHIRRSFDNKEVEFALSKSISRHKFILSYLLGFILVGLIILLPIITLLFFSNVDKIGLLYWSLSIIFELLIIMTFSILASLILSSAVSAVLASLGFYVISRMMAFFVFTAKIPQTTNEIANTQLFLKALLKFLSAIFPRLDLFAKSDWLIYGVSNFSEINIIIAQSLIYIPLLIFMSFYDFSKKQF